MSYAPLRDKAESLLKNANLKDAPEWLLNYCRFRIDKANRYREQANEVDKFSLDTANWRANRFGKACDAALGVVELLTGFLSHENVYYPKRIGNTRRNGVPT